VIILHEVIIKRLESLGYEADDADDWLLNFLAEKVSDQIENACNTNEIPDHLFFFAVDMVCAEFLSNKKGVGQLEGFDVQAAVKSINEGDTAIQFAVADGTDPLESLLQGMKAGLQEQLVRFRRLVW